jgi:hypothetical protein
LVDYYRLAQRVFKQTNRRRSYLTG